MINGNNFKISIFFLIFIIFVYIISNMRVVDAYVPVTYTCCYNYTYNDGVQIDNFEYKPLTGIQLDNFENLSNWTIGSGTQEADIVNFKEGQQGLKLIANNITSNTDKVINNNFSNTDNFAFWLYASDINTFQSVLLYFTSTTGSGPWSKYFYKGIYTGFSNGWNRILINKNSFKNYGNESWNNLMNRTRITVNPITGKNTNITIDDLRYNVENEWIGSSQEADKINFKEGMQGLKLIAINGSSIYSDFIINKNFSDINNFAMWVYVDNASNYSSIDMLISSRPWDKFFYDSVYGVRTGWNKVVFNRHSFNNYFNESWNNIMTTIRLRIRAKEGRNLNVTFDDLRNNMTGKRAKLMIEFDDGKKNVYSNAYPILKANNQNGVTFVVTSYNGPSVMNLSDMKTLQSSGWDISSHTVSHVALAASEDSVQISELNNSYDWLVYHNFQKSAGFIAYPFGSFNDAVIDKVKKRYVLGRSVDHESAQQHFTLEDGAIQYTQRIIEIYNDSSIQWVKDNINDTINAKLLGILVFHGIVDSNPERYEYLTTDFQVISDYIKSRKDDIDVITNSEYVIPNINNFTPVLNKITRINSNGTSELITKNKYDEYMPNFSISPSSDSIDINITTYNESGGTIKFNESSTNSSIRVSYSIGDRIPNYIYSVKIYWENGTKYQDFNIVANNTGYINFNSEFRDSRYQEISPGEVVDTSFTVTLPVGYTFLRFNSSNSTISNLDPDGQNNLQSIFNITNNGNINQSFGFYLNGNVTNITTYADLDNNHSTGRIEINMTSPIVITNLNPSSSQNIWLVIDAIKAPLTNSNRTLMINSS